MLRIDERPPPDPADPPRKETALVQVDEPSTNQAVLEPPTAASAGADDSADDLAIDLAIAALETGRIAFDAREWDDAEALFQEAVQILLQLSSQQRVFCDVFALHFRLAVCAFHTQEPAIAERALIGLTQQPVNSKQSEHQVYQYDAAHLLSLLYIRTGQIDFARSECERALQGRRRHLGKHSEASLESTALIAHIYALLNNRARAKACLAMIPESRRDEVGKVVEASLGTALERPDSTLHLVRTNSDNSSLVAESIPSGCSESESIHSLPMENRCYGPVSVRISQSEAIDARPLHRYSLSNASGMESLSSTTVTSILSTNDRRGSRFMGSGRRTSMYDTCAEKEAYCGSAVETIPASELPTAKAACTSRGLSRQTILRNLRCMPVDRLEEAVCNGDHSSFAVLLKKKNNGGFLRLKVQKALHSKRVTALHFAALFGEIEMARRLLNAGFEINEIPELSTSRLTPLKFAIGTRQVEMVELLVAHGAKPTEPDTWSTLIGQLMDRSWVTSTMSVAEREDLYEAPNNMIAIIHIWLKHGWNVNTPCDASSGRTVLHQAVAFESGFYKWDSNLRTTLTRFLCDQGADPLKSDKKGNTPYDMASVVEDQDLLPVLEQRLKRKRLDERISELVELSARPPSPVELFDWSTTVPPKPANADGRPNIRLLRELDGGRESQPP
jgi:hypothetical protein